MLRRPQHTSFLLTFLLFAASAVNGQTKWESVVYWNYTNVNLFNYDIVNAPHPNVTFDNKRIDVSANITHVMFAGDTLIAWIYPNRHKSSFGGEEVFMRSPSTDFKDIPFLANTEPEFAQQLITIGINENILLRDVNMDSLLVKEITLGKYLDVIKLKNSFFLLLHCKLSGKDSIVISTKDIHTGQLLDEYKFFKADPYPHIIALSDLASKEQFSQLILKRDSLQLSADTRQEPDSIINISPLHNDLLLLLRRFSQADSLRVEYRLLKEGEKNDTAWNITANEIPVIQFNHLEKGVTYSLQLRYNLTPYVVKTYTVKVGIHWWQITFIQVLLAFITGIALMGVGWSIYRRKKEKQLSQKEEKRKQLELQLGAVRAQLNPHFIFNSMGTLQSLINQNKIENANLYLGRVSKLMRSTLENSARLMTTLHDEIEYLRNYLEIESLRFHFQYNIEVDKNIPAHDIEIPSMFLQPIVENAIKHGLSQNENGKIFISIKSRHHDLIIVIQDNGAGFSNNSREGSFGLSLTHERIRLLNQILAPQQIVFNIENVPGAVTCIFEFKNWI